MKKISISANFILLIVFGVTYFAHAQVPLPCGKYIIDTAAENKAMQFRLSNVNLPEVVNYLVRVYFHNVANDDGSNAAITPAQLTTEFTTLLASYAANNLCFLPFCFRYVSHHVGSVSCICC